MERIDETITRLVEQEDFGDIDPGIPDWEKLDEEFVRVIRMFFDLGRFDWTDFADYLAMSVTEIYDDLVWAFSDEMDRRLSGEEKSTLLYMAKYIHNLLQDPWSYGKNR